MIPHGIADRSVSAAEGDDMTLRELLDQHNIDLDQQLYEGGVTRHHKPVDEPVPTGHPRRLWEAPTVTIEVTLAPWAT